METKKQYQSINKKMDKIFLCGVDYATNISSDLMKVGGIIEILAGDSFSGLGNLTFSIFPDAIGYLISHKFEDTIEINKHPYLKFKRNCYDKLYKFIGDISGEQKNDTK